MFQSLIGKLQTTGWVAVREEKAEFQSLIGKLQTLEELSNIENFDMFQSLIGKLQTNLWCASRDFRYYVSIPYR